MRSLSLRLTIATCFSVVVLVSTVSIASFALDSGRRDVGQLANSLHTQTFANTQALIRDFLRVPQDINRETIFDITSLNLDVFDREKFGRMMLARLQENEQIISMEFADEQKNDFGPSRNIFGAALSYGVSDATTGNIYILKEIDKSGVKGKTLFEIPNYDPRKNSWYITAVNAGRQTWTPIYLWPNGDVGIDAIAPIIGENGLIGVLDSALTLNQIRSFLNSIKPTKNTEIYLLEKSGHIVVGTDIGEPYKKNDEGLTRLSATESANTNLRNSINSLETDIGNIETEKHTVIDSDVRKLVSVSSYKDDYGLDWRIVMTTPESELLSNIQKDSRRTSIIITLAILLSIFIAFLISSWIAYPLNKLTKSVSELAEGKWESDLNINRKDEIGILADAFKKMRTKLRDVDTAKNEFISLASHQLRTPLTTIKWMIEMLVNGDMGNVTKEQKEGLENISVSNERMIALVNSLLSISKLSTGRLVIKKIAVFPREIIDGVIGDLRKKINEKELKVSVGLEGSAVKINTDPQLLRVIFENLIGNAVRYAPTGSMISITLRSKEGRLVSEIKDTGRGIPKNEQRRIFEKFFRASNISKIDTAGTGLGLYLTKSIVELLGGAIWFESEEGKGATFYVSLPVLEIQSEQHNKIKSEGKY